MANGLDRLWLNTIVSRNYEHHQVRHTGTLRPHGGECFVTRSIEEGDHLTALLYLVRANVLGDPAGFGGRDSGTPNGIQKCSLTMVYVTHDRDYRWTRFSLIFIVELFETDVLEIVLFLEAYVLHLVLELRRHERHGVDIEHFINGSHASHVHQVPHHNWCLYTELVRQLLDRDHIVDADLTLLALRSRRSLLWP